MGIPKKDSDLVSYVANFQTRVVASPPTFNLTVPQAAGLEPLSEAFLDAYSALQEAKDAGVRSEALTATKNETRAALVSYLRMVYGIVQDSPTVTDANKLLVGVTVRKSPTPIGPPTVTPEIDIVSVVGRTVTIRVHAIGSDRHSKPTNVYSIQLYTFTGTVPPEDPELWRWEGSSTATEITVDFPLSTPAGSQVWFKACYTSPRTQCGPASAATPTYLQYGSSSMAA